jgi:hypothetical protein
LLADHKQPIRAYVLYVPGMTEKQLLDTRNHPATERTKAMTRAKVTALRFTITTNAWLTDAIWLIPN